MGKRMLVSRKNASINTENNLHALGSLLQTGLSLFTQNPHLALGVEMGANIKEIRSSYKKLAIKYHPDKNPKTTILFQAINAACTKLSDPALHKQVDQPTKSKGSPSFSSQPTSSNMKPPDVNSDNARRAEEERRRREDELKAKETARRFEEEARKRQAEELKRQQEEDLRQRKEEIIREGQRAYFEEKVRADKEAQVRLERRAAEIAAAARRAMNSNVPPADAAGLKNFRGVGAKPPPSHPGGPKTRTPESQPSPRPESGTGQAHHSGRTFSVDPSGNVKPHRPSSGHKQASAEAPPKAPSGLQCTSFTETVVDLQWSPLIGLVELNWRNCALGADNWRSANKLISGTKCRKKNLLAGAKYEFRIRTVTEKPGGMLGLRSPWAASITVQLKSPPGEETSSTSYSYSGSEKIKKEVFIRPANMRQGSIKSSPTPTTETNPPPTIPVEKKDPPIKSTIPASLRPESIDTSSKRRQR